MNIVKWFLVRRKLFNLLRMAQHQPKFLSTLNKVSKIIISSQSSLILKQKIFTEICQNYKERILHEMLLFTTIQKSYVLTDFFQGMAYSDDISVLNQCNEMLFTKTIDFAFSKKTLPKDSILLKIFNEDKMMTIKAFERAAA